MGHPHEKSSWWFIIVSCRRRGESVGRRWGGYGEKLLLLLEKVGDSRDVGSQERERDRNATKMRGEAVGRRRLPLRDAT